MFFKIKKVNISQIKGYPCKHLLLSTVEYEETPIVIKELFCSISGCRCKFLKENGCGDIKIMKQCPCFNINSKTAKLLREKKMNEFYEKLERLKKEIQPVEINLKKLSLVNELPKTKT